MEPPALSRCKDSTWCSSSRICLPRAARWRRRRSISIWRRRTRASCSVSRDCSREVRRLRVRWSSAASERVMLRWAQRALEESRICCSRAVLASVSGSSSTTTATSRSACGRQGKRVTEGQRGGVEGEGEGEGRWKGRGVHGGADRNGGFFLLRSHTA